MTSDDELCLCFHVTKRKVLNFLRVKKPQRASQMSECFGAGTGCGWCRPYLQKLFEAAQKGPLADEPIAGRRRLCGRPDRLRQIGRRRSTARGDADWRVKDPSRATGAKMRCNRAVGHVSC